MILINPCWNTKYPQPPLGLASLAAVLEKRGYKVSILDANVLRLSIDEIAKRVENIVGITAMTPIINSAIKIARKIKGSNPNSTVILGGPHATVLPEEILRSVPEIDIIVRGEGERTIVDLYEALSNGEGIEKVDGIVYRDKKNHNKIRSNLARAPIMDLDSLPFLAYHLLPIKKYRLHSPHGRRYPLMAMLTSRGCQYKCVFCSKSVFGSRLRFQSPERIVGEIRYLKERFKVREIAFYDDTFTIKKERTLRLCKELKDLDILWSCETRVNLVTKDLLMEMKKAGCYMIAYGIESGNQNILNNLRKGITLNQIKHAIEATHEVGIQSIGYFMIGSPGETPQTIRETIDLARTLPLDFAQFSLTVPFPGTELYNFYPSKNWDYFVYASLKSCSMPVLETEVLSKEELLEWNARAYKEFYFRLSYIWKRFLSIRCLGDIKTNLKGLVMLSDMLAGREK